jgi:arginine/ornithine N-succinyltransferase beta subunit
MATLGEAVVALLTAGSPPAIAAQLYAGRAHQSARVPFIIYQQPGREGFTDTLDGAGTLAQKTIQIDIYGAGYHAAHALADQIRAILNGYRGTVAVGTASPQDTIRIAAVRMTEEFDIEEDQTDPKEFRVLQQYLVTFAEP